MLRLPIIMVAALAATSCATTNSSSTPTPLLIASSGNYAPGSLHRAKRGEFIIREPVTVTETVSLDTAVSFKARNPTLGVLGPPFTYSADAGAVFYPVSSKKEGRVYCLVEDDNNFKTCLIDGDQDGKFEKRVLNNGGSFKPVYLFQEGELKSPVGYTPSGQVGIGEYFAVRYGRNLITGRGVFTPIRVSESGRLLGNVVASKEIEGQSSYPYTVNVGGAVFEILGEDNDGVEYKVVSGFPSNAVLIGF